MKREDDIDLSPVFAHGLKARPQVRQPQSSWSLWAGVAGSLVLGVMVFNGLNGSRQARAQAPAPPVIREAAVAATAVPAPPPQVPPILPPQPNLMPTMPVINPSEAHWRAPALVVDFSTPADAVGGQVAQAAPIAAAVGAAPGGDTRDSPNERFAARAYGGAGDVARASQMRDLGRTIAQGTTIAAVLETAINSDLPGSVRAVVSRDIRSFDGSRVLIPRGSKLVGQYKSAAAVGQTRAFVVWSRIITPTGISVDVSSPATDRLGRGGLDGEVDTHFFQRFGSSILLSVVSAGLGTLASNGGNNTTLVIGSTTQASRIAEIALTKQIEVPDTIKVKQGVPVQVFVARDLDFGAVVR